MMISVAKSFIGTQWYMFDFGSFFSFELLFIIYSPFKGQCFLKSRSPELKLKKMHK